MMYQEFNRRVFEYYIKRTASSFCTLSMDTQEMKDIIYIDEICQFHILKSNWNYLLHNIDNIPQYFGLIAIQCYAASLMHNDGQNAADAYQIRLLDILNLEDASSLQHLFKGESTYNPIQEEIWIKAKNYLKDEFNLILNIPNRTINAGRYVQYPKSQALLNTEDLKCFTQFFSEEFQIKEIIPFEYFKDRLYASFENIKRTNRVTNLWYDSNKREQCAKQVYNYYNLWGGEIYIPRLGNRNNNASFRSIQKVEQEKLILKFNNEKPEFYSVAQNPKKISEEDILSGNTGKKLIIFNELDFYQNEYEESRFLYKDVRCYILLDSDKKVFEFQYLESNNEDRIEIRRNKILYEYKFEKNIIVSPLSKYFQSLSPVRLNGGIKIKRSNEYLKGYAPSVVSDLEYSIFHENYKCDYDPENAEVGKYKIRTDYFPDIEFYLIEKQPLLCLLESKNRGWDFSTYSVENSPDIEGCWIKPVPKIKQEIIREWINANLKKNDLKKYNGDNILIKAINNSVT